MKKIFLILFISIFYISSANAICFLNCKTPGKVFSLFSEDDNDKGFSGFDPSSSGCVYNEFG